MIVTILQAHVSSKRLPEKVLKLILNKPLLQLMIERVRRANRVETLVVATSDIVADDPIETLCQSLNVFCFRGDVNDVLDRYYRAATLYEASHIVRLTGDCPLADPALIDRVVAYYFNGRYDYASSSLHPSFPDGLDVEIFSMTTLTKAWREARLASQREHVTAFINQSPDRFRLGSVQSKIDRSYLRWTVDEPEDFELVRQIYEGLYRQNPRFSTGDILELLEKNPEISKLNAHIGRNEGYHASLLAD